MPLRARQYTGWHMLTLVVGRKTGPLRGTITFLYSNMSTPLSSSMEYRLTLYRRRKIPFSQGTFPLGKWNPALKRLALSSLVPWFYLVLFVLRVFSSFRAEVQGLVESIFTGFFFLFIYGGMRVVSLMMLNYTVH